MNEIIEETRRRELLKVEELIKSGQKKLDRLGNNYNHPSQKDIDNAWAAYLSMARSYLPQDVRWFLTLSNTCDRSIMPSKYLSSCLDFRLLITDLHPIVVRFTTNNQVTYLVGMRYDDDQESLGYPINKFNTFTDIEIALAYAQRLYQSAQDR